MQKHDEKNNMISTNSKQENSPPNLETSTAASSSSSAATSWHRLKDPRIVRVSRAFGGKDRHSKVCTIRGLRDRRVRLSVSTAIQLYDLQDRLGLNQPSKVVDWLLNAAKDEIDKLPPLPVPSESLGLDYQSMLLAHSQTHPRRSEFKINPERGFEKAASNVAAEETRPKSNSNFSNPSSYSSLLNNVGGPQFGYNNWEASSTTNLPFFTSQAEDLHNFNNVNLCLPSPLSLSTGSHYMEFNHLHQNFLNNSNNSLEVVRPFHFSSMAPKFVSQEKNINGDKPN